MYFQYFNHFFVISHFLYGILDMLAFIVKKGKRLKSVIIVLFAMLYISCASKVETVVIPPLASEDHNIIEESYESVPTTDVLDFNQDSNTLEENLPQIEIQLEQKQDEPMVEKEIYPVYGARLMDRLTLEIVLSPEAMLSVPEQMLYFLPMEKNGNTLYNSLYNISLSGEIPGTVTFSQAGMDNVPIQFELISDDKDSYYARPQDPVQRNYLIKEITINFDDGTKIAGELTALDDSKERTAVILINGSGTQNRNEELANHRPFLVLSDYLTKEGFAVLRTDDRGIGGSTGDVYKLTTFDFADDVIAEVRFLKQLGYKKICLVGHSEGGTIASIVADVEDVSGIVTLGAPAVSGVEISLDQLRTQFESFGYDELQINTFLDIYRDFYESVVLGDFKKARAAMEQTFGKATADTMIESVTLPWNMTFLSLDPSIYLSSLPCKTLVLQGSLDSQVRPEINEEAMLKALSMASGDCSYVTFEGKNHLFQNAKTGMVDEYGLIAETISPDVMRMIVSFVSSL